MHNVLKNKKIIKLISNVRNLLREWLDKFIVTLLKFIMNFYIQMTFAINNEYSIGRKITSTNL